MNQKDDSSHIYITKLKAKYILIFVINGNKVSYKGKSLVRMKVVAINKSSHKTDCTYYALKVVCSKPEENDIEFEIINVGNKAVRDYIACDSCR